ncbi:Iron-uptake factor PiuC [hydrothermal vent metagenome]|uniref:Iron-uptake factor PiuC n=1 Tax=hydrothermal vent metagenome TaxID=652676 RepID=A0A3B0YDG2_9ZZZZ
MLVVIPAVLDKSSLEQVRSLLNNGRFVDGRLSAGTRARQVKQNEELQSADAQMEQLNSIVMGALVQHPHYQAAAMPVRVATPFYARYTKGMHYGDHVDDPIMGPPGGQYRSDISTTVFLNEPDTYEGGELVIRTGFGEQAFKLAAGNAIIYPSSSLHHVAEVTNGERLVAVTWTQSMVRDPARREILYQLYQARESLLKKRSDDNETAQVDHAYVNLMRLWAEL